MTNGNLDNRPAYTGNTPPYTGNTPRRGGSGAGWWWVFIIFIIIVVIWIAWGGWGNRRATNAATTPSQAVNTTAQKNAGNMNSENGVQTASIAELTSDPQQFQGRRVVVPDAVVQKTLGDNAVLVNSGNKGESLRVVLPSSKVGSLNQGERIEVTGMVMQGSSTENSNSRAATTAKENKAGATGTNNVYLQASAVTPATTNAASGQTNR